MPNLDDIASMDDSAFAEFASTFHPAPIEQGVSLEEDSAEVATQPNTLLDAPEGEVLPEECGSVATDLEAFYTSLTAPIKAAGKEITFTDAEEIRTLVQKGIGFEQRMGHLKKFQRHVETLDKENLLNDNTLNLIVDLARGKPEALKKYIVSNNIDIYDVIGLDAANYTPEQHIPTEDDYAKSQVVQEVKSLSGYDVIQPLAEKDWDTESRNKLLSDPGLAANMIEAAKVGIHAMVLVEAEKVKLLASQPISDLDAYVQAGEKLHKQGAFDKMTKKASNVDETIKPKNVSAHNATATRSGSKVKSMADLMNMSDKELRAFAAANNL